jgi:hypothetical protein
VFNPSPIVPRNGIRGVTSMVRVARMGSYPIMPRENVRWVGPELPKTSLHCRQRKKRSTLVVSGVGRLGGGNQWLVRWTRAGRDASARARSPSEPSKQRRTQGLVVEETSLATNVQAWLDEPKRRTRRRQGWVAGGGWASCRVSLSRLERWWVVVVVGQAVAGVGAWWCCSCCLSLVFVIGVCRWCCWCAGFCTQFIGPQTKTFWAQSLL